MRKLGMALGMLATLVLSTGAMARDFETIKKDGTLRFATEGAFAPFNFFQGAKLTGFEVELAEALARKMGLKIHWDTKSFDSLLIGLDQDRYDVVIASHGITAERQKTVDFTDPHYCTGGIVVSRKNGPSNREQLKGKVVAAQLGTTYASDVQKIPGIKDTKFYPKDPDAFQSLMAGRVDAWVTDRFLALETSRKNSKANLQIGELLFVEKVAMPIAKGNESLRKALNEALAALMKDGTYAKLSQSYFGQDIRCAGK